MDSIRARVESGATLDVARRAAVTEFLASPDYVPRSPAWRGLLELHGPLAAEPGTAALTPDPGAVRSGIERILSRHFGSGFDLKQFARSDEFHKLRTDLWNSYYANVALPDRRPQDRSLLEFWIKLFEVIARVSADYPWVPAMEAMRPVIPFVLVHEKRPKPEPPDQPVPSARREQILRARNKLAELKAAEAELKRLLEASQAEPPVAARQPRRSTTRSSTSLDDGREPWTIKESDLSVAVRQTLSYENISVKNHRLPVIIDNVQGRIAKAYLRLHGLERVTEVVLSGGVYVRRRRKIRVEPHQS
jgi:hypothetical protein